MSRVRKRVVAAVVLLALIVAVCALAWHNIGALALFAQAPGVAFVDETPPTAPDHADPHAWSALPDRDDAGDLAPDGSPAIDHRTAPADVFYVHPAPCSPGWPTRARSSASAGASTWFLTLRSHRTTRWLRSLLVFPDASSTCFRRCTSTS